MLKAYRITSLSVYFQLVETLVPASGIARTEQQSHRLQLINSAGFYRGLNLCLNIVDFTKKVENLGHVKLACMPISNSSSRLDQPEKRKISKQRDIILLSTDVFLMLCSRFPHFNVYSPGCSAEFPQIPHTAIRSIASLCVNRIRKERSFCL
jgi:hypothetical protein